MNLQTGAFGNPADPKALILFWTKMEMLHYPGASETRKYLEEELQRQKEAAAAQAAQQQMMNGPSMPQLQPGAIEEQARQAAERDFAAQ